MAKRDRLGEELERMAAAHRRHGSDLGSEGGTQDIHHTLTAADVDGASEDEHDNHGQDTDQPGAVTRAGTMRAVLPIRRARQA